MHWYARLLAHHPLLVIGVVLVVAITCLVITVTAGHGLEFDDPIAGFEPRGTVLSDRLIAFNNLVNNEGGQLNLEPFSTDISPSLDEGIHVNKVYRPQGTAGSVDSRTQQHVQKVVSDHKSIDNGSAIRTGDGSKNDSLLTSGNVSGYQQGNSNRNTDTRRRKKKRKRKKKKKKGNRNKDNLVDKSSSFQDRADKKKKKGLIHVISRGTGRWGEQGDNAERRYRRSTTLRDEEDVSTVGDNQTLAWDDDYDYWSASSNESQYLLGDDYGFDYDASVGVSQPFCGVPDKVFSRLVVTSTTGRGLFNVEDLKNICQLEQDYLVSWSSYGDVCVTLGGGNTRGRCCQAWSLGNYVTLLSGKARCENLTTEDVTNVYDILQQCSPFFYNFSLSANCEDSSSDLDYNEQWYYNPAHRISSCNGVPDICKRFNAVYYILHFLTDANFLRSDVRNDSILHHSTIFLPVVAGSQALAMFNHIDQLSKTYRSVTVAGVYFGVKFTLFEQYLYSDTVWIGCACVVIILGMWMYTSSLFVTIMAFLSLFWAVEISYFVYRFIFRISFFPYMNMVTLIVMVGVGADDLFIYCKGKAMVLKFCRYPHQQKKMKTCTSVDTETYKIHRHSQQNDNEGSHLQVPIDSLAKTFCHKPRQ